MSPTELVRWFFGSSSNSQPPTTSTDSDLAAGSAREAQCRRVATMTSSPGRRYLATSLRARRPSWRVRGSSSAGRRVRGGVTSDEGADEVGQGRRRAAEGLARALDERGRVVGELDHVEHHEGDDEPDDDLLHAHHHLRAAGGSARGANRLVPWGTQGPAAAPAGRRPPA